MNADRSGGQFGEEETNFHFLAEGRSTGHVRRYRPLRSTAIEIHKRERKQKARDQFLLYKSRGGGLMNLKIQKGAAGLLRTASASL